VRSRLFAIVGIIPGHRVPFIPHCALRRLGRNHRECADSLEIRYTAPKKPLHYHSPCVLSSAARFTWTSKSQTLLSLWTRLRPLSDQLMDQSGHPLYTIETAEAHTIPASTRQQRQSQRRSRRQDPMASKAHFVPTRRGCK
jgi:hypothetical protein